MWLGKITEQLKLVLRFNRGDANKLNNKAQVLDNSQQSNTQVNKVENLQINQGRPVIEEKMLTIVEKLVDQNQKLLSYQDAAQSKALQRNEEFKGLIEVEAKKLSIDEMTKLEEPDTQAILSEASVINARTSNADLRKILTNLVIRRVKDDSKGQEELKNIVYNEAIRTIPKLTNDQLKIITLDYLLNHTINNGIRSWENYNVYLNNIIKPLIDFRSTHSEFRHIVYSGCASISMGSWDLATIIRDAYTFLFLTPITDDEVQSLNLPEPLTKNLIEAFHLNGLPLKNAQDLEDMLNSIKQDEESKNKIIALYKKHIPDTSEVQKMIVEKTDIGKEILRLYRETEISHLELTSVGTAVAIANFEQMTGQSLNIDLWIN